MNDFMVLLMALCGWQTQVVLDDEYGDHAVYLHPSGFVMYYQGAVS